MLTTVAKTVAIIFVVLVLTRWMTGGQDNIVDGPPPPEPEVSYPQP